MRVPRSAEVKVSTGIRGARPADRNPCIPRSRRCSGGGVDASDTRAGTGHSTLLMAVIQAENLPLFHVKHDGTCEARGAERSAALTPAGRSGLDCQRLLLHSPDRAGYLGGHRADTTKSCHSMAGLGMDEADRGQDVVVPLTAVWRFTDQKLPAFGKKPRGAFDGVRWRPKAPADNNIVLAAVLGFVSCHFGSSGDDTDPMADTEFDGGPHKKGGALRRSVEEDTRHVAVIRQ